MEDENYNKILNFKVTPKVKEEKVGQYVCIYCNMRIFSHNNLIRHWNTHEEYRIPNNNLYCYCQEKEYGKMIKCDNKSCEIKWFHLRCCNILYTNKLPKNWFCNKCKEE